MGRGIKVWPTATAHESEESLSPESKSLGQKHVKAWAKASEAVATIADRLADLPGVFSVHAQYAEPLAVVVVLVETEAAKHKVHSLEGDAFDEWPEAPLDIHVQRVTKSELAQEQAALSAAYGLLWSRA